MRTYGDVGDTYMPQEMHMAEQVHKRRTCFVNRHQEQISALFPSVGLSVNEEEQLLWRMSENRPFRLQAAPQ